MSTESPNFIRTIGNDLSKSWNSGSLQKSLALQSTIILAISVFGQFILKAEFFTILATAVPLVLFEKYFVMNAYLLLFHHNTEDRWKLSLTEKIIAGIALIIFNTFLFIGIVNINSTILLYRALPWSQVLGIGVATWTIFVDWWKGEDIKPAAQRSGLA